MIDEHQRAQDRFIRLSEVMRRTGLSRATIYRQMAQGGFPQKVQLSGNVVAWYERDLNAWVANPAAWGAAA